MAEKDAPAFPVTAGQQVYTHGMTLRDWFAGQALAGMCGHPMALARTGAKDLSEDARLAYRIADAMLAAREAVE